MKEFSCIPDYLCWYCDSKIFEDYEGVFIWDGEDEYEGDLAYHPNDKNERRPYCSVECLELCLKENEYFVDDFPD